MELAKIFIDDQQLIKASREGITKEIFTQIMKSTGLTLGSFAQMARVTARTLQRKKPGERISPEASERAIIIGKLYFKGYAVFGDKSKFHAWMDREQYSLGRKKPVDLLDTITGISLVEDELIRIEYGFVA